MKKWKFPSLNIFIFVFILLLTLNLVCLVCVNGNEIFSYNKRYQNNTQFHYYDKNGNVLLQYDFIFKRLIEEYGDYTPSKITILKVNSTFGESRFNPQDASVIISNHLSSTDLTRTIAHESAHLCNYNLSNGANILTQFRFIDEGYANIIGNLVVDSEKEYYKSAMGIATVQKRNNNISLDKVQAWNSYGGGLENRKFYAYPVGSSFDYFIINKYSKEKFYLFFKDLGVSKNLEISIQNVFSKSIKIIESEWLESLNVVDIFAPKVIEMFPLNNLLNVDPNIKEIFVKFNVDMNSSICVGTNCEEGICYKNAYWKSKKILAIRIDSILLPNHSYKLSLGYKDKCRLISNYGEELPLMNWEFQTK
ncbi:MAG: hypothetical protein HQK49_13765 [Oligoflexia bacterium]|nr:hypothetical protein [Oligoflexia bacterium]